jgi:uncharacterized protein (TIGR02391 family)
MNLETRIDRRLWEAIAETYQARNYTASILDSFHFIGNLIREKTGLESDGVALIGQAFGGNKPKLVVNRFQTESEKNIQAGLEQIFRGLYQAIRNPRSHEKYADEETDAAVIILFVNYLLKIIDKSKGTFGVGSFLDRVFDSGFVEDEDYAKLIVKDIPEKHRYNVFVEVFRKKETGNGNKLKYFVAALWNILSDDQKAEAREMISEELRTTDNDSTVTRTIQIMPTGEWPAYDEVARMRIENKLLESVKGGLYSKYKGNIVSGSLGTWTSNIAQHLSAKAKRRLIMIVSSMLRSENRDQQDYVFKYIFDSLSWLSEEPGTFLTSAINKGLESGDRRYYVALSFDMSFGEDKWGKPFRAAYDRFVEVETPPEEDDDDLPF